MNTRHEDAQRAARPRPETDGRGQSRDLRLFLLRAGISAGIVILLLFMWSIRDAFLLAFISIVFATILLAISQPVRNHTPLNHMWSLTLVSLLLVGVLTAFAWMLGAQIQSQVFSLAQQLPASLDKIEQIIGIDIFSANDSGVVQGIESIPSLQSLLTRIASFGTSIAGMLSSIVLVIVAGFFLAAEPKLYSRGFVKLFPVSQQARIEETLNDCGHALYLWLIATFISMSIVGTLVALGAWAIGLPSPIALGLFAFLSEFVPVVGPIIGAVPGLLLAFTEDSSALFWTALLYLAVQQLESNMIMPVIQRRMVTIPPALLLFAVTASGLLFGFLGVLVAAPLTVVAYTAVNKLYIHDTLGQRAEIPGEDENT